MVVSIQHLAHLGKLISNPGFNYEPGLFAQDTGNCRPAAAMQVVGENAEHIPLKAIKCLHPCHSVNAGARRW